VKDFVGKGDVGAKEVSRVLRGTISAYTSFAVSFARWSTVSDKTVLKPLEVCTKNVLMRNFHKFTQLCKGSGTMPMPLHNCVIPP
jgi:hypothetical protein